jgi:hypothetical protein
MSNVIMLDAARRKRHGSFASLGAGNPPGGLCSTERLRRLSDQCGHLERIVFDTLELIRDLDGRDAVERLSERLMLQIASRVVVECGHHRAIEMLDAVAAGTIEVGPVPG